jgi:sugar transferase EpsL
LATTGRRASRGVKRAIDIGIASAGLVVLAPLMALVALGIRTQMGRPVVFRQMRPGYRGEPFALVKFRTMTEAVEGQPLPADRRLTRLGLLLRRASLDELPQLWNILKGDMSLVGPRPLLMEYLPHYTPEEARRHDAKPGLTGWAQVHGRQVLDFEDRFMLDVWYVDHWSLWLDLKILAMTARRVGSGAGLPPVGHAYPEFSERHQQHVEGPGKDGR